MGVTYYRIQQIASNIKDSAILTTKLGLSIQTGTGTPPVGGGYISFATAFGTPPFVDIWSGTPIKQGVKIAGHGGTSTGNVLRVSSGSFKWQATPTARYSWRAEGQLDTSGG